MSSIEFEWKEPLVITAKMFYEAVGRPPTDDDLERCNCPNAGKFRHRSCGWNKRENKPVYSAGPDGIERMDLSGYIAHSRHVDYADHVFMLDSPAASGTLSVRIAKARPADAQFFTVAQNFDFDLGDDHV
jgi:hypothetical protein